jgi:hypothetical protein
MKYIVKLSYLVNEFSTSFAYIEYIVKAENINSAKNKAIIQLIKELDPYHFIWNEAYEYNPNFNKRSDTPLDD